MIGLNDRRTATRKYILPSDSKNINADDRFFKEFSQINVRRQNVHMKNSSTRNQRLEINLSNQENTAFRENKQSTQDSVVQPESWQCEIIDDLAISNPSTLLQSDTMKDGNISLVNALPSSSPDFFDSQTRHYADVPIYPQHSTNTFKTNHSSSLFDHSDQSNVSIRPDNSIIHTLPNNYNLPFQYAEPFPNLNNLTKSFQNNSYLPTATYDSFDPSISYYGF